MFSLPLTPSLRRHRRPLLLALRKLWSDSLLESFGLRPRSGWKLTTLLRPKEIVLTGTSPSYILSSGMVALLRTSCWRRSTFDLDTPASVERFLLSADSRRGYFAFLKPSTHGWHAIVWSPRPWPKRGLDDPARIRMDKVMPPGRPRDVLWKVKAVV
jgi:hypothetical protein